MNSFNKGPSTSEPCIFDLKCKFCGKRFACAKNLKMHELSCDNFHCLPGKMPSSSQNATAVSSPSSSHSAISGKECCQFCHKVFSFKNSCVRHEKTCQSNKIEPLTVFTCGYCGSTSNRKDNFNAHMKKCHQKHSDSVEVDSVVAANRKSGSSNKKPLKKTPCLYPGCELEYFHKTDLIAHLQNDHEGVYVSSPIEQKFGTIEEFNQWKEEEQERTYSYFCMKKGQHASRIKHFYCQHDGQAHSQRKSDRCNKKGRVKVGHFCIAQMKVWKDEGQGCVNLLYYPTHSHRLSAEDFSHHPLPKSTDMFINERLSWGVSPSKVFITVKRMATSTHSTREEVRKTIAGSVLNKKRIRERARKLRERTRIYKDDAKSLFYMVKQLEKEEDSILIYKPFNSSIEIGPKEVDNLSDSENLFMLGIQRPRQADLMAQHSHRIIVMDETHGTNQYGYQLLNVMIVDENKRGWPVAHLITNKSDAETLKFFFQAMKAKLPQGVSLNCVITDDDPALINSMEMGFGLSFKHILCKWHVIKNLKDQVRKKFVASVGVIQRAKDELQVIINTKDEDEFNKLCKGFIHKYKAEGSGGMAFVDYFEKHYVHRAHKWAACYRNFPHGNVNTTGHVESFHNKLKKTYLKRKVNRRLDDLLNILLNIEYENHLARIEQESSGRAYLPHDILERHKTGITISDENFGLDRIDENTFDVRSFKNQHKKYIIERYHENCPFDLCLSKCTQVSCSGLCSHMYSCSCPDDHPLCKHIHKLHTILCRDLMKPVRDNNHESQIDMEVEQVQNLFVPKDICEVVSNSQESKRRNANLRRSLQESVLFLQNFLETCEDHSVALSLAAGTAEGLVNQLRSLIAEKKEITVAPMIPSQTFAPNEKLKTQISQLAPFKRPLGKRKLHKQPMSPSKRMSVVKDLTSFLSDENESGEDDSEEPCSNFTPSLNIVSSDITESILRCGPEKISLIHLKSLELSLSSEEFKTCRLYDSIFKVGWLYCSIINAFLFRLSEKYPTCLPLSSDLAVRASLGVSNLTFIKKLMNGKTVSSLLFPANLSGNHWSIVAVTIGSEPEVKYYDPLQCDMSPNTVKLLQQINKDMQSIFPLHSWEDVTLVKAEKQMDSVNCGVFICSFAEQIAQDHKQENYLVGSVDVFRKHMYNLIVGGCLKRWSSFDEETCGVCFKKYSTDTEDNEPWISCHSCDQWFHHSCVNLSVSCGRFVCPP